MTQKEISKEAWRKANEFFKQCIQVSTQEEAEENLDLLRNTCLYVLGIDSFHLAVNNKWGPNEFMAHMVHLSERIKDIYLAQNHLSKHKESVEKVTPLHPINRPAQEKSST